MITISGYLVTNIKLPNLKQWRRNGRLYTQYRKKVNGQVYLTDIRGEYGSREWIDNYHTIKESFDVGLTEGFPYKSTGWLIEKYILSPEYKELKVSTKIDYKRSCEIIKNTKAGKKPFTAMKRPDVMKLRDYFADIPSKANKLVRMLSTLGEYAISLGIRTDNPAKGVRSLKNKGDGNRAWTESEMQHFVENCENNMMLIAFFVALFTGQRQGDCLDMARTNDRIKNGMIKVVQEKTATEIYIPYHPLLQEVLGRAKKNSIYFICREDGKKFTTNGFRANWNRQLQKIGLATIDGEKGCTFHGLRANAAAALAEAGCSNEEIMSITGHKTDAMVKRYTRSVQQVMRAQIATKRLEDREGVSTGGVYSLAENKLNPKNKR